MSRLKTEIGRNAMVYAVAFVLAAAGASAQDSSDYKGDPYTLGVCPVSGQELGAMGDAILFNHEGRDIRFCCAGCRPQFEQDPQKFISKIDALMIEDQKGHYPLETDVVSGQPLPAADKIIDIVYFNRLVRLGSQMSAQKFYKSPDKYTAKLDEAVIAKQLEGYPIDTCVVSGEKLDVMGDPIQVVAGNRLVQFCCEGCKKQLWKDPRGLFSKLDGAASAPAAGAKSAHEGSDHK